MSALEYRLLDGGAPPQNWARPIKQAAGVAGLLLVGAAGWASRFLHHLDPRQMARMYISDGAGASGAGEAHDSSHAFKPADMDKVLLKPGPPGPTQFVPNGLTGTPTSSLFLLEDYITIDLMHGTDSVEDGKLYGAHLTINPGMSAYDQVAVATGNPADFIVGKLLTWPAGIFPAQLRMADDSYGYDALRPTQGFVMRRIVPVVRQNGTTRAAHVFFKHIPAGQPWHNWPADLPAAGQPFQETPETKFLSDGQFLAKLHQDIRKRVFEQAKSALAPNHEKAAIVVRGGDSAQFNLYDSDCTKSVFRQEAYFLYLFGLVLPDCYGVLDLERKQTLLFVPKIEDDMQRWLGTRKNLSWYSERYLADHTYHTDQLAAQLAKRNIEHIHVLSGTNTDSGLPTPMVVNFPGMDKFRKHVDKLHPFLTEMRVIKTPMEVEYLRVCNRVSSQAHVYVMRHTHPGMNERHLEALFKAYTSYYGGARHLAYTAICASGANGAILHYGWAGNPNDQPLRSGESVVLDMGAEYNGYCTDLTRSFPINGKFTKQQRTVYEAVLDAHDQVIDALKPGVNYADMHRLAERVLVKHLMKMGILVKGTEHEMEEASMAAVFMPHGLGHFVGLLTHDVGGFPPGAEIDPMTAGPKRPDKPGLKWLRMHRVLKENMVLTVEPGLYFNDPTLDKALANPQQARYIDQKVLALYRGSGGVRIEDDVVITKDGVEVLSGALPVQPDDIEAVMKSNLKDREQRKLFDLGPMGCHLTHLGLVSAGRSPCGVQAEASLQLEQVDAGPLTQG
eukprot:g52838.t1